MTLQHYLKCLYLKKTVLIFLIENINMKRIGSVTNSIGQLKIFSINTSKTSYQGNGLLEFIA